MGLIGAGGPWPHGAQPGCGGGVVSIPIGPSVRCVRWRVGGGPMEKVADEGGGAWA